MNASRKRGRGAGGTQTSTGGAWRDAIAEPDAAGVVLAGGG
jgi:hypothetical protein